MDFDKQLEQAKDVFIILKFAEKMEMISQQLAAGRIDKELLYDVIKSIMTEDDYSEDLKIRIINAIKD